ncbi:MAG: hypothetical protein ACYS47_03820 [Planctomycetota bacterium]
MPLAFTSKSHGTVAFGFFNIELDMLLLQNLFFFADRFCAGVVTLASGTPEASVEGWRIQDPGAVGDLHGAIAGTVLSGFIGETYRVHPFPERPEDFKQNPDPAMSHAEAEALVEKYGVRETIRLVLSSEKRTVSVGEYVFSGEGFGELVDYVDRGGYPRWKDEVRPAYVSAMMEKIGDPPWGAPWRTR